MQKCDIKLSSFSLAKGRELKGDDYYDIQTIGDYTIAIVCDGVGGAIEGNEAARRTVKYIIDNFKSKPNTWSIEKTIKNFITSINSLLYQESINNYENPEMVTTLALVVISGDKLYAANVGDTRIYLHREDNLTKLSNDHTLKDDGYTHMLTEAIGLRENISYYYFENIIKKDDTILICSDGLYEVLNNEEIVSNIHYGAYTLVKKASHKVLDYLPDDTTAITLNIPELCQDTYLNAKLLPTPEILKQNDTFDGYKLIQSLTQNNRTWLCTKKGEKFVIKFAPIEVNYSDDISDMFTKEVWNSNRIESSHFPKAFVPQKRTSRYYIQEYIDSINLKQYIKHHGTLHIEDSINLAKTLLEMSQSLLKLDLVHADIKPENILVLNLNNKLSFKVIDFGNITEIYSITSTAGTPSYLAPERFEGNAICESTEIFSIGITLYEALTGKLPYGEIEPFQKPKFNVPKSPKNINQNIPNWLENIILKSITVDKDIRYSNYSNVIYDITHKDKVKPFYDKSTPLIERNPLL